MFPAVYPTHRVITPRRRLKCRVEGNGRSLAGLTGKAGVDEEAPFQKLAGWGNATSKATGLSVSSSEHRH